jgi:hypothetical protein
MHDCLHDVSQALCLHDTCLAASCLQVTLHVEPLCVAGVSLLRPFAGQGHQVAQHQSGLHHPGCTTAAAAAAVATSGTMGTPTQHGKLCYKQLDSWDLVQLRLLLQHLLGCRYERMALALTSTGVGHTCCSGSSHSEARCMCASEVGCKLGLVVVCGQLTCQYGHVHVRLTYAPPCCCHVQSLVMTYKDAVRAASTHSALVAKKLAPQMLQLLTQVGSLMWNSLPVLLHR